MFWLKRCKTKGFVTEEEYIILVNIIKRVQKILRKILLNLSQSHTDLIIPPDDLENIEDAPIIKKIFFLINKLDKAEIVEEKEWVQIINKRLRNSIENIAANISESEQYYLSKKLRYLNQPLQESNVVKNDLTLIKKYFFNEENFFEINDLLLSIQIEIIRQMEIISVEVTYSK